MVTILSELRANYEHSSNSDLSYFSYSLRIYPSSPITDPLCFPYFCIVFYYLLGKVIEDKIHSDSSGCCLITYFVHCSLLCELQYSYSYPERKTFPFYKLKKKMLSKIWNYPHFPWTQSWVVKMGFIQHCVEFQSLRSWHSTWWNLKDREITIVWRWLKLFHERSEITVILWMKSSFLTAEWMEFQVQGL